MASATRELRIQARKLGISNARELSREELEDAIAERENGRKSKKRGRGVAKAVKATKKRGRGRPRKVVEDDDEDEAPRRKRGRPKGSTNKKRGPGRPPKSEKRGPGRPKGSGKKAAKATSTRKRSSNGVGRPAGSGTGTRVALSDRIKWNMDFDFREGSTSDYILTAIRKAAKKYKDTADIREEVFDKLVDNVGEIDELTFMNRATGRAHKGEKGEDRLRYYINRTMFDYAVQTGQHEGSGESAVSQPREAPKKRGRPKGSTTKKRGPGRPRKVEYDDEDEDEDYEEETPRRRGRPKGSKNKVKRGRGRPKGSKNKASAEKPRRGRPPGKRGPGRPKGSKNKSRR